MVGLRLVVGVSSIAALVAAGLAVGPVEARPAALSSPAQVAGARLAADADGTLTRTPGFVGVPAGVRVADPAVTRATGVAAAASAHLARYGAAFGTDRAGTTFTRSAVSTSVAGDTVRYQQYVDGLPVLGGDVVVSLRDDRELSSILAKTSDQTSVADPTVSEADAEGLARAAFLKGSGAGTGTHVVSLGRWVLDPALVGGDTTAGVRTAWRFEVTRAADEGRMVMVDDRTGGVLVDADLVERAEDRVVCDNQGVRQSESLPCTSGFARTEGMPATGQADVDTAYDLSGATADFYQQVGGVDLTDLLGMDIDGHKSLASTVRWCVTGDADCPYANAFWNGSQMYYGEGYAVADDVVAHEITHGFTEHHSGLLYWGQSGAMNESLSDIIGEIVDHRHVSAGDSPTSWSMGEDIPGLPDGVRNVQDPTLLNDPDSTSSPFYVREGYSTDGSYPDKDGVHSNSGVGNKTFYLISQGGAFGGQTMTGIDQGDPTLTKSGKLWLLVDESLSSGSDYADLATVLDQSCQALLADGASEFTAADCTTVHQGTLATRLRITPVDNPQVSDATATCPTGDPRVLFDSETGTPEDKFIAGSTWTRDGTLVHSGTTAWTSAEPSTVGASSLTSTGVTLPAGRQSFLFFQRWHVLDYDDANFYDGLTVEVDDVATPEPAADAANLSWVNGPKNVLSVEYESPAGGRRSFSGDTRGYLGTRLDLSSYAGKDVAVSFTMNTDNEVSFQGAALDDITVYSCDPVIGSATTPSIRGRVEVGRKLTAKPGTWTPGGVAFRYAWLRDGTAIGGATKRTYVLKGADKHHKIAVRVTGRKASLSPVSVVSKAVGPVR